MQAYFLPPHKNWALMILGKLPCSIKDGNCLTFVNFGTMDGVISLELKWGPENYGVSSESIHGTLWVQFRCSGSHGGPSDRNGRWSTYVNKGSSPL
jgi:hypothetical protein